MNSPKISIIVPVYKVEKYMHRCLDSIVDQTFTDWECILIDDGSPDNSGKICDEYAEKDARFRVIHQENAGVSAARNAGLDAAKGEWIGFVDSDDWINKETYEVAYNRAVKEGVDLIQWGCILESSKQRKKVFHNESIISYENAATYWEPSMCHKLVLRKLICDNNLTFPIGIKLSEDRLFAFMCYLKSTKSLCIENCFYHYRMNQTSATHSMTNEMIMQEVEALKLLESAITTNNIKLDEYITKQKIETKKHCILGLKKADFKLCRNTFPEINRLFLQRNNKFSYLYIFIHLHLDFIAYLIIILLKTYRKF